MTDNANSTGLTFANDAMFKRVMRDEDICKGVLERILGKAIGRVEYLNTEQELYSSLGSRSIRMDSYLIESGGRTYDVEMQMNVTPLLPMRFRCYQSVLDTSTLKRGEDYDSLPESYIIFICTEDPFGERLPVYTFKPMCSERPALGFDCRANWIALNSAAYGALEEGDPLGTLLKYIYTNKVQEGDGLLMHIDAEVKRENSKEWAMTMMNSIDMAAMDGRVIGRYEAEERYSKLIEELLAQGRTDDLKQAAADPGKRKQLYEELGI